MNRGHRLSGEKGKKNFPGLSTWKPENFQAFWMKGGFKHLPSEETGRIKTLLEHLSFLLSNLLKSTGSIALPLVSIGSSHRCQQKPPQEQNCLCWCSLPASHKKKKKIKEKNRELSEGKIILNLHLGKAQSFVFITPLPRQIVSFPFHVHPWILCLLSGDMGRFWLSQ